MLSVAHGDTITATYLDADDGAGSGATSFATADVDCVSPVISNVQALAISATSALVTWDTDEPATSAVSFDGVTGSLVASESKWVTSHEVTLYNLTSCSSYTFSVGSTDLAGNETVDDNSGSLYDFDSGCPGVTPVPDGSSGTMPMTVRKASGNSLRVDWDNSCPYVGSTKLIHGPLSGVSQYLISGSICSIPSLSQFFDWTTVPSESAWFLMLREDGALVESSWGQSSAGERNGATVSGQCSALTKNTFGTCP